MLLFFRNIIVVAWSMNVIDNGRVYGVNNDENAKKAYTVTNKQKKKVFPPPAK